MAGEGDRLSSFRPALDNLAPYSAGRGAEALRRTTGFRGQVVKLASNEGQYGPFPSAMQAMAASLDDVRRYPEAGFVTLRAALAERHGVGVDRVFVGSGGCAILHHLALSLLGPGDESAFCWPTFTAYGLEAQKMGAKPVRVPLSSDGSFDLDALLSKVGDATRLVHVCNPNNPTGNINSRSELTAFLDALPGHVLPVIDEAYFDYVDRQDYPDGIKEFAVPGRRVVVMRTFSKIYGLAGLRVAYAICPADVVEACSKVQNPFEVNRLGLIAALASLGDNAELTRRAEDNRVARLRLVEGLRELDHEPHPTEANFVMVTVGDGSATAARLEEFGVIVRPLGSMGDPASIRVTVGTADEIDRFLEAFAKVTRAGSTDPGRAHG